MGVLSFFTALYYKIKWLVNLIFGELNKVYPVIKPIITEIKNTNLSDEDARKAVFQKATDALQELGINIPDSRLNLYIEIVYQLIKLGKA